MSKKLDTRPLTGNQEAFVIEYIKNGGNGSAAYRKAYDTTNYADKTVWEHASVLLAKDKVRARLAELKAPVLAKVEKDLGLTREWVLAQLKEVVEMAKAASIAKDADGNPVGETKQNLAAANKALELIGKEVAAMFVDRKEIRTGSLLPENLDHDELKRLNAELDRIGIAVPASNSGTTH